KAELAHRDAIRPDELVAVGDAGVLEQRGEIPETLGGARVTGEMALPPAERELREIRRQQLLGSLGARSGRLRAEVEVVAAWCVGLDVEAGRCRFVAFAERERGPQALETDHLEVCGS